MHGAGWRVASVPRGLRGGVRMAVVTGCVQVGQLLQGAVYLGILEIMAGRSSGAAGVAKICKDWAASWERGAMSRGSLAGRFDRGGREGVSRSGGVITPLSRVVGYCRCNSYNRFCGLERNPSVSCTRDL